MEWLGVALIGAVIGTIVSFIGLNMRMPQVLVILVATVGAIAGGLIDRVTQMAAFGTFTFYIAGAALSIVTLAGAFFAYSLVNSEKRDRNGGLREPKTKSKLNENRA
ncbi:MAG: hypothetical protein EOP05_23410 [Proteobacteria bacterium]|nr:MAG: hypothetical protein EOP05_23410 [Pseudomonadota bacterium]